MAEKKSTGDLDWLGCRDCKHNDGTPENPVCGHPQGVRFFLGTCCINWQSAKYIYLPTECVAGREISSAFFYAPKVLEEVPDRNRKRKP
jgi:hypothetical protein